MRCAPLVTGCTLYVRDFPYSWHENDLRALFESCGCHVVSVRLARHKQSGRSRGYGFVELPSQQQAADALRLMNGVL